MFTGKTVFAQLMSLIPLRVFNACDARYKGDYHRTVLQMDKATSSYQDIHYMAPWRMPSILKSGLAVCSFFILALAKKKLGIEQSLYTIS